MATSEASSESEAAFVNAQFELFIRNHSVVASLPIRMQIPAACATTEMFRNLHFPFGNFRTVCPQHLQATAMSPCKRCRKTLLKMQETESVQNE